MEIQNEILRNSVYILLALVAFFVAIKVFPFTLSLLTVVSTSPIGLIGMLITFVIGAVFWTFVFTANVIEPKNEVKSPEVYNPHNKESIKQFEDKSDELQKSGLIKVSEKIVFFEVNEKPIVIETIFRNDSPSKIVFGYAIQFMYPNGKFYAGTSTETITLNSGETVPFTLISPSSVTGRFFVEEKLFIKGIFFNLIDKQ